MSRLRLLMTADAVGGVWQYAIDLAAALAAHDVETVIAVLGPDPSADQRRAAQVEGVTLVETGLPLDWLSDAPTPVVCAGEAIAELAAEHEVDVIQLNSPALAARAHFPAPVAAVTHGCVATWWEAARAEPLSAEFEWHRELMREGLRRANVVVSPSRAYADRIRATYALDHTPLAVHNGRAAIASGESAASHDMAITVGRLWDSVKGVQLLDSVADALAVPFYAAGAAEGPHGERVELNHLQRLGQLDAETLGGWLARRPVFVSAARFEPFGLAVLEAAQAGCPLVLSDIATFRELWDSAALFVPTNDPTAYQSAIMRIIADAALRQRLGEAARERAARYTPQATAHEMARLYRALAATQPARRVAA
jgi:glycosyltransferase involved in cell wall biosynthesis